MESRPNYQSLKEMQNAANQKVTKAADKKIKPNNTDLVMIQENKNITLQRVFKNFLLLDHDKRGVYVSIRVLMA